MGIAAAIASKQAGAPFTVNNFIAVCIVTELLNLLSLGRYTVSSHIHHIMFAYEKGCTFISSKV